MVVVINQAFAVCTLCGCFFIKWCVCELLAQCSSEFRT